ncbi:MULTISPECIES: hypothetical protein [unclassified Bradyrhizobium]|uniref:hypothetical protein n=1 Tax=unclassified Bradyrhizobium TaxID=2631580 RepID=UPI001FFBE1C1|nr:MULTISPECIES: hypothetical protein [unclassified Bradyrhizobium]MCK1303896.1 hypothetical protein [Bradyrhizobium sp. 37]MCK1770414.1 hypothetical protein [Bradyrhizobium sp. 134]
MIIMDQFSDQERERIIAESRALMQRGEAEPVQQIVCEPPAEDVLIEALSQPLEDRVERWRREADEQTARFERARRRRERKPAPVNSDLKISEAIAEERGFLLEVLAEAIAELAQRQTRAIEDALRPLQVEMAHLKVENGELKVINAELRLQQSSADHGNKLLDLPPILRSRAN